MLSRSSTGACSARRATHPPKPALAHFPRLKAWTVSTVSAAPGSVTQQQVLLDHQGSTAAVDADATAAPATPFLEPATAASSLSSDGPFPWSAHWYPMAVVDQLDPGRPHAAHLLGQQLVLWRDAQGAWHAHEDKCPHRLAPLSEGRIEADGTLQCSYHGWTFDGSGACTHIPQLRGDDKAQRVACASPRACVRSFPCQVLLGMLWVLPDSSEAGWKQASTTPTPATAPPELLDGSGWGLVGSWFVRDVPVRYDSTIENLIDPSHVPFAHHGTQSRRGAEQGSQMSISSQDRDGISVQYKFGPAAPPIAVSFGAPNLVRYNFGALRMIIYVVPTKPGWVRFWQAYVKDTSLKQKLPPPSGWLAYALRNVRQATMSVPWIDHILIRQPTLDGDTYLLHLQERMLLAQNNEWRTSYFMPAQADRSVVAFRRWLDEHGGVVPTCEPGAPMPPLMDRRQALDRYQQHTAHCAHCQKALKNIEAAAAVLAACGALAAAWLVARAVAGLPLLAPAAGLGLLAVAACGWGVAALVALRQKFFFEDYVHAHR